MACFFQEKYQHFTAVTGERSEKLALLLTEAETRTSPSSAEPDEQLQRAMLTFPSSPRSLPPL